MPDRPMYRGCGTALVTPFRADGSVDEAALSRLVRFQIENGIDFLVPLGTTGESATMTPQERLQVLEIVQRESGGRVPLLVGAGGNDTRAVIQASRGFEDAGARGLLSVTPYYNKPTQEGLYRHFMAIAEAVHVPVVLYNVPGRTGVNLEVDTALRLASHPNIVGVKEASGNIVQIAEIAAGAPDHFVVLSGDDALTVPVMAVGGVGVISVVSNQVPGPMTELTRFALSGRFDEARRLNARLLPLMKANFVESNPVPVKAGLALMGLIEEHYRLPLAPPKPETRERLRRALATLEVMR